ncbi:MAG: SPOR domain-containing protein [Chthoniobacter sp.]|nr:SPOR domain-containing protein [Chthoniobacter sp.]
MEQNITVATFNDRAPAEKIAQRLRDAGLHADIYDESNEQKWKLFNLHPRAHMRVRVHSSEEERAHALVKEWHETEGALTDAVHCPECGSSKIEFPQFSRRTLMGALPAALAATGVIAKEYYCEDCHFTWPDEVKPEPLLDALNWPRPLSLP